MSVITLLLLLAQYISPGFTKAAPAGTNIGNVQASTAGYTSTGLSAGSFLCVGPYTVSVTETLLSSSWWLNVPSGSLNAIAAVYSVSGTTGTLVQASAPKSITGTSNQSFTFSSGTLVTSTNYLVCIADDGSTTANWYYLTPGSTGSSYYYATTAFTYPTFPSTATFGIAASFDILGYMTVNP